MNDVSKYAFSDGKDSIDRVRKGVQSQQGQNKGIRLVQLAIQSALAKTSPAALNQSSSRTSSLCREYGQYEAGVA